MAKRIVRGGTQDPTNGVQILGGTPVGSGELPFFGYLSDKFSETTYTRNVVAAEIFASLSAIPVEQRVDLGNNPYLAAWCHSSIAGTLIQGYVALFNDAGVPIARFNVGFTISTQLATTSPQRYAADLSTSNTLAIDCGPARYAAVVLAGVPSNGSTDLYLRPYA